MRPLAALVLCALPAWAAWVPLPPMEGGSRDQDGKPARPPLPAMREETSTRAADAGLRRAQEREKRAFQAVERSLAYLSRVQARSSDGSFPATRSEHSAPVATAALAALAYMAGGSTPDRGPHGRELSAAIDYLISRCDTSPGSRTRGYIASEGDQVSRMHGQGFATLALSQAYTMSPATPRGARLRTALEAAVHLIETTQGPEGGWFYFPEQTFEHENSVTVCLAQGLRGAHGAGVKVDPAVVARAVDYVRRCQNEDGAFRYALNRDDTSAALTAAGIATMNATGVYEGPVISRALDALARDLAARDDEAAIGGVRYPHYERLYVAQALWQAPDARLWESWRSKIVAQLESEQAADGSWHDAAYGDAYATAMHSLVLSIPLGFLPIFQR